MTPHTPKLMHWQIAQVTKAVFAPVVLMLDVQSVFWETWHQVFRPSARTATVLQFEPRKTAPADPAMTGRPGAGGKGA